MKRKSTLVDSVSAEPEVSAVGRKQLSSVVIPQNKANRLRNVSSEPVYAAPLARRSQSPTRRRATFNFKLLTAFAVLLCLFFGGKAWGQVSLPYSYGFENNNLSTEGWTTANPHSSNTSDFGIATDASKTGSYGFRFSSYDSNDGYDQYLISPQLSASSGCVVTFSYKASSSYGTETFKVGYSTTNANTSSFTFGTEISTNSTSWAEYENTFPAGTKYIAIYYYSDYQYRLFVDDFSFTSSSGGGGVVTYCNPSFSDPSDDYISSFVTTGGTSNINNTTGASTNGYGDYYSTYSASIAAGQTLSCTVTSSTTQWDYGHAIWVDWNKDGDFSDSGERVAYTTSAATGNWTGNVVVPAATPSGDYRMRVMHYYNTDSPNNPCVSDNYGEVEDYKLTVISDPYVTLSPSSATVLTGFTQTLTATRYNVSGTPSITYTSSNTNVATVSGSGTSATVTAVAPGTCTITATMTYQGNNYTATCAITVEDPSYCEPSFSEPSDDYISNFATSGGTTNINNTSTYVSSGYSDYYNNNSVSIEAGATLTCTVTSSSTQWDYGHAIWVDWNKDYEFTSEERVAYTSSTATGNWTGSFVVPANIVAGDYRMRVIHLYNNTPTDPCMSGSYGEAEDYKLTVTSSCLAPTNVTVTNVTEHSVSLEWTPRGSASQWIIVWDREEYASTHPAWRNYITTTATSYTITDYAEVVDIEHTGSLTPGTEYRFRVFSDCGELPNALDVNATTESACPKPTNVHAGNLTQHTAQITWNGNADSYTVRYRTANLTGTTLDPVFEDGFESGLTGWTTYARDYDNAITNWQQYDGTTVDEGNHTGNYVAASRSWHGSVGDQHVDNWLVSPQMILGNTVKFWVATNAGFEDSYAVYVSTGSGVVPSSGTGDFTEVANLTPATGTWVEQTYDISAFAGQQGYVAIRHKDYAHDHLLIDDFGVYNAINTYSYGTDNTISPATSPCNITGLNAETLYEVSVQADCGDPDGISGWSSIYFTTPDACSAPTDLVSSSITTSTATLGWADNQDSYNLRYRKVYFYEGFEGETLPTGWTTIDANSDGNTWHIGSAKAHSGSNGACNLSYIYQVYGITPNDWLVSPQLDLQGTLRVWLSGNGIGGDQYSEHFQIYVSTTGNSAGDFTTTLVGETTTGNTYVEYTADLSSYAGQQGYIAIRHFNCTDQNYLYVDDFGLYGSENWVSVSPNPTDATATLTNLSFATDYEWQVQGINCDGVGGTTNWSATSNFTTLYPTKIRNTNPAADEMTWEQFVGFVNGGYSYAGQTVTLMENISVTTMAGAYSSDSDYKPFSGTFDGQGKTITINVSGQSRFAAPFKCVENARIQNVRTAGTISGVSGSSNDGKLLAGVVGISFGSTVVIGCSSSIAISSDHGGDSAFAGIVAAHKGSGSLQIEGCVFTGSMSGSYNGTINNRNAGIMGYQYDYAGPCSITNSFFAPSSLSIDTGDASYSGTIARLNTAPHPGATPTITNCYYTTNLGTLQGTKAHTITGVSPVNVAMGGSATATYEAIGLSFYSGGLVYNGTIYGGTGENVELSLSGSPSGNYRSNHGTLDGTTLTMEDYDTEISALILKIRNNNPAADEMTWAEFAGYVNGGYSYAGQTVTLMENISVSDMVGTSSHPFRGTFEGDGKTITANISSSEQGAAPFRYISGATIQNLKVDGTVTSTAHHASGLVGFCADGSTNTIQNCLVSTNVTNSNSYNGDDGNNFIGGIIGHNMSATTSIIGCVYDGTITSQGFKGGMVGFGNYDSNVTITDSYFAGAYSTNGYSDPNFSPISCHGAGRNFNFTFSNFYYNTDAGTFTAPSYEGTVNAAYNGAGRAKHAYSVTGVSPVTVAMNGSPTTYNVSGIAAYSTGIVYDVTIYGGDGDVLALSLDGSSCGYEIDHGNLNGSSLTMEAHNTVISAPVYTISASVNPAGTGTVSGTGSYICGATATLEATANTGYHFVNWTKNSTEVSTSATYNFTVTEAADYVANFEINTYTVTTVIHPTEGGSAEGAGTYTHGSSCTLAATANTGYQFVNWTASNGSVVSANASYTFTVTGDVTYQANFTKTTVTSLPWTENFEGYSCGTWEYLHGEWATPLRWTKAACVSNYSAAATSGSYSLEMRANNSTNLVVLPQFDKPLNKLKIKFQIGRGNAASGYTVQLGYVTDPSDASTFHELNTINRPSSAVPAHTQYTYDLTTDANAPSSSEYRLAIKYTMSGEDSWYLDDFDVRCVYTIAVSDNPSSTASDLAGAGKYDHGANCTVTATAGDCYNFVNWTENGTEVSTSASYSFTAEADRNLVANFTEWTLNLDNTSLECINTGTEVVLTASATSNSTPTYAWEVSSGSTEGTASSNTYTVSPTALSNTYTVSATVGGCERTQTATITTKPVINSEPSSSEGNEFCLGVSTNLSVESNAPSFTWDNGAGSGASVTVTPTATTTYTVSARSGDCVSTSSITITVNTPDITDYDYIWRGVSDDWNYSSNWYMYSNSTYSVASGDMPTEAKNYYIGTGDCLPSSSWPSLSADATIGDVTIDGGSVTVPDGVTLSIAGTISGALTAEEGSTIEFVGSSDQTISGSQTFSNVKFSKGGANVITATNGLAVNGTATFTSGIVSGNVTFGEGGSSAGANLNSYVDGTVTKNGNNASFTFPTGSDGVLGTITATITSGQSATAKFNHKASGFDQEHDGYPRWWNLADMCGAEPFNHVSNFEYWDFNTTADLSGVTFVSKASSADAHFHNPSEYPADDSDIIQIAVYDGCWKNIGGHLEMSDENKTITISGVNASRGTTRSGSAITTFGSKDPSVLLPIELTSFTATCDGRSALVEWSTASERNNDYFSLERSDDAINFTEVARVAGAGNSIEPIDYAYTDYGIHGGDNYYRLVQVDYDGTRTVSEVIVANCIEPESDGEPEVLAYPNPFSSELTVVLDNFGNRAATIEVYDMLGKLIYTNKISAPQNSYETILNLSNLPPAAYTVRVSTNDFVINRNVVKN